MLGKYLENVRATKPLVHNITNYVTVHDVANIIIACGASPIMSDDAAEVADITSICNGLNINIGTLNERTIRSMTLASTRANELGHKMLLDPVGAGASPLRTETAMSLLSQLHFDVIRGNASEIKTIYGDTTSTRGVDASDADKVTGDTLDNTITIAKNLANKLGSVVAVTGAIDIVTDGDRLALITNGDPMLGDITGSGCMLSGMTTAFISANDDLFMATTAAVSAMGLAGEIAKSRLNAFDGNASYSNYVIDAIYRMTGAILDGGEKVDII